MLFSTRFFRPFRFALALAGVAASTGACSIQYESLADDPWHPNETVSAGAGGQSGAGGRIDLPPTPPPVDDKASFTDLCGGGCMTNDQSIGCSNAMSPDGSPLESCQITASEQTASAVCLPPGTFGNGEPCETAADCAASLGCVRASSGIAVCRPYCCGDIETCEKGSICSPMPMAEQPMIVVPVCAPTTPCKLLDSTSCPPDLTCTLVRTNGTTDCVKPGVGKLGEPCPCAPGHICSGDHCVALCNTNTGGSSECPIGKVCQGGTVSFPDGIGVCVP